MNGDSNTASNVAFGVIFIVIGSLVLLNEFDVLTLTWSYLVPIVLIIAGIAVIITARFGRASSRNT